MKQGGFAGAVLAKKAMELAGLDLERDIVIGDKRPETLVKCSTVSRAPGTAAGWTACHAGSSALLQATGEEAGGDASTAQSDFASCRFSSTSFSPLLMALAVASVSHHIRWGSSPSRRD